MKVTVGTFNLNNLFSRYNFRGEIDALADKQTEAWIDRRTTHSGDGSDHDPAWVVMDL